MSFKRMMISAATLLGMSVMSTADAIRLSPWHSLQHITNTMINYGFKNEDKKMIISCDATTGKCGPRTPEPRKYYNRRMNMTRNATRNMTGRGNFTARSLNSTGNATKNSTMMQMRPSTNNYLQFRRQRNQNQVQMRTLSQVSGRNGSTITNGTRHGYNRTNSSTQRNHTKLLKLNTVQQKHLPSPVYYNPGGFFDTKAQ